MTVHMTAAEFRALGREGQDVDVQPAKVRVRRTAKGPYHTVCRACSMEFNTKAAEDRHVVETRHARYEMVLGYGT